MPEPNSVDLTDLIEEEENPPENDPDTWSDEQGGNQLFPQQANTNQVQQQVDNTIPTSGGTRKSKRRKRTRKSKRRKRTRKSKRRKRTRTTKRRHKK